MVKKGPITLFADREAPNSADCKSAGYAFACSNHAPTTTFPSRVVSNHRVGLSPLCFQLRVRFPRSNLFSNYPEEVRCALKGWTRRRHGQAAGALIGDADNDGKECREAR